MRTAGVVTGLVGALAVATAWGSAQRYEAHAAEARTASVERELQRSRVEVQLLSERVASLEDEWRTLSVVRTAVEFAPLPAPSPPTLPGVTAPQAPLPAFLNINSIPPSTCSLDGKPLGDTPQMRVTVSPGRHVVRFERDGASASAVVTIAAGETKVATAKLAVAAVAAGDGF